MLSRKYAGPIFSRAAIGRVAKAGFVLLLLTTVVIAQISATHHDLTVRHAICPQHGEVIDVDDAVLATGVLSESAQGKQISIFGDSSFEGHHQHCLYVSSRGTRDSITLTADPSTDGTVTVDFSARRPLDESAHLSPALYLAAPKHSPPLA